jgi:hypothetical protein
LSDFTNIIESSGSFSSVEEDTGVDFRNVGDGGSFTVESVGWGDGGWGDIPWGGEETVIEINSNTAWTNVDEP